MGALGAVQLGVILALAGALALKILAQSRRGVRAVVIGRAGDGVLARLEPFLVLGLFLWFATVALHGAGVAVPFFEPRLFRPHAAAFAGAALALAGLGLLLASFVHMGRSWRIGIDPESREQLVTTGVFGISRNPIYVAIDLLAVSAFAMSGSLYFLLSGLAVMAGIHVQILREERFLATAFGAEYAAYRRRVHRYLGRGRPGSAGVAR